MSISLMSNNDNRAKENRSWKSGPRRRKSSHLLELAHKSTHHKSRNFNGLLLWEKLKNIKFASSLHNCRSAAMQNDRKKPITEFQRRYGLDAQINPIPRNVRKKNLQTQISLCVSVSQRSLSLSQRRYCNYTHQSNWGTTDWKLSSLQFLDMLVHELRQKLIIMLQTFATS